MRISPGESLKRVDLGKIDMLQATIVQLQQELEEINRLNDTILQLQQVLGSTSERFDNDDGERQRTKARLQAELERANEALIVAEAPFPDILLAITVEAIPFFGERIPVSSRLVPFDNLYGLAYFDQVLLKALKKGLVFDRTVTNVYQYDSETGTYQDLNCGAIYRRETVFSFTYKETPTSQEGPVKFVRRTDRNSEEPRYYPILASGHVGLKAQEDIIDNDQYVYVSMAEEIFPNTGSILCAREIDQQGTVTYYGVNFDGTKGELLDFRGETVLEKLRTPYNKKQVL
jgi:hypothetical protein